MQYLLWQKFDLLSQIAVTVISSSVLTYTNMNMHAKLITKKKKNSKQTNWNLLKNLLRKNIALSHLDSTETMLMYKSYDVLLIHVCIYCWGYSDHFVWLTACWFNCRVIVFVTDKKQNLYFFYKFSSRM